MVARRPIVSRREPYWLPNKYVWPSSSNIRTNAYPLLIFILYRSNFYRSTTVSYWLWYSCFITHPNCHHQITYCKLNLKINYPPPFKRLVWDYKKANSVCIKETLRTVNWDALFHLKSVHEQVNVFDVVINIFSNFVLNKIIGIGDREPPWMNDFNKNKIKEKNKAFKQYKNNFSNLQKSSQELSELITKRKEDYNHHLANKLNDPQSLPKTFWKVLKAFYNGNKIPLISTEFAIFKSVKNY